MTLPWSHGNVRWTLVTIGKSVAPAAAFMLVLRHGGFARVRGFAAVGRFVVGAACLGHFFKIFSSNKFFLYPGSARRSLVGWPFRKIWAPLKAGLLKGPTKTMLVDNHWALLLDRLNAARQASPADFTDVDMVNADASAVQSWKIVAMPSHFDAVTACANDSLAGDVGAEAMAAQKVMVDDLISKCLKHVKIEGRPPLTLDDCCYIGCVQERGAYFPSIHWDTECNLAAPRRPSCHPSRRPRIALARPSRRPIASPPHVALASPLALCAMAACVQVHVLPGRRRVPDLVPGRE